MAWQQTQPTPDQVSQAIDFLSARDQVASRFAIFKLTERKDSCFMPFFKGDRSLEPIIPLIANISSGFYFYLFPIRIFLICIINYSNVIALIKDAI